MIKKHWKKIVLLLVIILITASIYILNTIGVLYLKPDENTNQEKEALGTKKFTQAQLVTYNGDQFYSLYDVATTDTTMEIFAIYNLNSSCAQENAEYYSVPCIFASSYYWTGSGDNINLNNVAGGDTQLLRWFPSCFNRLNLSSYCSELSLKLFGTVKKTFTNYGRCLFKWSKFNLYYICSTQN